MKNFLVFFVLFLVGCGERPPNPHAVVNEFSEGKKVSVTELGRTNSGITSYSILELEHNGKKYTFFQGTISTGVGEAISLVKLDEEPK